MHTFTLRQARIADAPQLAALANQHTYEQLDEAARQSGFLTGRFTAATLAERIASAPGIIAMYQEEVAGFVVNSHLPAEQYPPFIQEIIALLPGLFFQQQAITTYRWFFYGPILVLPPYRGQGLLQELFHATQRMLASHYEVGVAFIAERNVTSLHLHTQKLGLEVVGHLVLEQETYILLAFAVK
ncbi:GNAT family N-acetyltransferase [Hymenobacter norwichensis]|uniref:GNAT family N-acetyltransferase n=1 Tax=Hymenobacter norwichensis TaxID=223903 RepID=UPI0003B36905|nr:GNAT family N-acetyltransferase [Hymenobacter norwichensis]